MSNHTAAAGVQLSYQRCCLLQDEEFLKRFLEYARFKCSPRLTEAAAEMLQNEYVAIRREVSVAQTEVVAMSLTRCLFPSIALTCCADGVMHYPCKALLHWLVHQHHQLSSCGSLHVRCSQALLSVHVP